MPQHRPAPDCALQCLADGGIAEHAEHQWLSGSHHIGRPLGELRKVEDECCLQGRLGHILSGRHYWDKRQDRHGGAHSQGLEEMGSTQSIPAFRKCDRLSVPFCTAQRVPLILCARRADRSINASPRRHPLVSSQDELRDTERGGSAVLSDRWTHGTDSPPRQHDGVALRAVRPNLTRLATGQ